eukprot:TRINITY_DN4038_c0_g1_i6.p1 TRINITY_DN4038_c0_g1~~TRINITY_DN4038_c0_g1_i6.p1  ORF type:complete len:347 (-),score=88.32 TRINITY_DN4038_c0_g1_i6:214-1254(-)
MSNGEEEKHKKEKKRLKEEKKMHEQGKESEEPTQMQIVGEDGGKGKEVTKSEEGNHKKEKHTKEQNKTQEQGKEPEEPKQMQIVQDTPKDGNANCEIVLDNLNFLVTAESIENFFSDSGKILKIDWANDALGKFAGRATITMESPQAAEAVLKKDGKELAGRKLRIYYPRTPSSSLVISQLSMDTTEEELREIFETCGEITSFRFHPSKPMAFIDFDSVESTKKALKLGQQVVVRERALFVDFALVRPNQTTRSDTRTKKSTPRPPGCRVLFCGGIPLDATEGDMYDAFKGLSIESMRWLMRNEQFKGVVFVTFLDESNAEKAFERGLSGIVIKGRTIRLDWEAGR